MKDKNGRIYYRKIERNCYTYLVHISLHIYHRYHHIVQNNLESRFEFRMDCMRMRRRK